VPPELFETTKGDAAPLKVVGAYGRVRQYVGVTPVYRHQAARNSMGLAKPD
jgi:hypothetical protein